jgi:hypothetical protein
MIDVGQQVAAEFQAKVSRCREEVPNVVAVGWPKDSRSLVVVVESPSHSSCPDMGAIAGYTVEVPSGIIKARFDKNQLRKAFGSLLGPRLISKY